MIAGVNVAAAKINVIDCDGYGLANYFEGRCREGEYKKRDALFIKTRTGEKIVLASGLGKDGEEKKIKGNTYGMVYITEVNECHPKGIQECFDRTLSSKDRKIFHDLNPKAEGHFYYSDILNFHEEKQKGNSEYGLNYGHFTIADNMSLTQQHINRELDKYDKKSVWYLRDILGQRKQAEGLVYPMFNREFHVVPTIPRPYEKFYISNDFGVQHPCVFQLWGLADGVWYLVKEYYHNGQKDGQKTVEEYYNDLLDFADGYRIQQIVLDNAPIASSFNVYVRKQGQFGIVNADNDVAHGMQEVSIRLRQGGIKYNDCCPNIVREKGLYSWDNKSAEDKPIKENDDCCDCERYFINTIAANKYAAKVIPRSTFGGRL